MNTRSPCIHAASDNFPVSSFYTFVLFKWAICSIIANSLSIIEFYSNSPLKVFCKIVSLELVC